jgi:hypothetical protein
MDKGNCCVQLYSNLFYNSIKTLNRINIVKKGKHNNYSKKTHNFAGETIIPQKMQLYVMLYTTEQKAS